MYAPTYLTCCRQAFRRNRRIVFSSGWRSGVSLQPRSDPPAPRESHPRYVEHLVVSHSVSFALPISLKLHQHSRDSLSNAHASSTVRNTLRTSHDTLAFYFDFPRAFCRTESTFEAANWYLRNNKSLSIRLQSHRWKVTSCTTFYARTVWRQQRYIAIVPLTLHFPPSHHRQVRPQL